MKKVIVECRYRIEVEVPDEWDENQIKFEIEENSCPATRLTGSALRKHMKEYEDSDMCWACALQGTNTIVPGVTA